MARATGILIALFVILVAAYKPSGDVVFVETFDEGWPSRWTQTAEPNYEGKFIVRESELLPSGVTPSGHKGLVVNTAAKHYGAAAKFKKALDNKDKDVVFQYEVKLEHGLSCGGAYLKFLSDSPDLDLAKLNSATPYTIMFGPDKCGFENKVHFILRHQNPISKEFEEKHSKEPPKFPADDQISHLYTLHIQKDNSYAIYIDQKAVKSGNLLTDMNPAVNPPTEIDDPTDSKPSDWEDEEYIVDAEAKKPEDWDEDEPREIPDATAVKPAGWLEDEPAQVPDPDAKKPADWDDEEDGEYQAPLVENPLCTDVGCGPWTAPLKRNPKFKGKWIPPKIKNPKFIGKWAPKKIPNPDYFNDEHPSNFNKIGAVAIEIWTMSEGIVFSNLIVTHDKSVADDFAANTWYPRFNEESRVQAENTAALKKEETPGIMSDVKYYWDLIVAYAQYNPALVVGSALAGLIPVILCCVLSSKPPTQKRVAVPATSSKKASKAPVEDEDDGEIVVEKKVKPTKKQQEEIVEEEELEEPIPEPKTKSPAKKRTKTPKA